MPKGSNIPTSDNSKTSKSRPRPPKPPPRKRRQQGERTQARKSVQNQPCSSSENHSKTGEKRGGQHEEDRARNGDSWRDSWRDSLRRRRRRSNNSKQLKCEELDSPSERSFRWSEGESFKLLKRRGSDCGETQKRRGREGKTKEEFAKEEKLRRSPTRSRHGNLHSDKSDNSSIKNRARQSRNLEEGSNPRRGSFKRSRKMGDFESTEIRDSLNYDEAQLRRRRHKEERMEKSRRRDREEEEYNVDSSQAREKRQNERGIRYSENTTKNGRRNGSKSPSKDTQNKDGRKKLKTDRENVGKLHISYTFITNFNEKLKGHGIRLQSNRYEKTRRSQG